MEAKKVICTCALVKTSSHWLEDCPDQTKVRCQKCWEIGHHATICSPSSISKRCYNCGQIGHIIKNCAGVSTKRMDVCWTCGGVGHIRTSPRCPGPHTAKIFCSYCRKPGPTEKCPCNQVEGKQRP